MSVSLIRFVDDWASKLLHMFWKSYPKIETKLATCCSLTPTGNQVPHSCLLTPHQQDTGKRLERVKARVATLKGWDKNSLVIEMKQ